MRRRTVDIHIMLNQEEGQRFDDLCKRTGLTRAGLIRKMVLDCPIKERPHADFFSLIDAVDRIGVNFNQLVRITSCAIGRKHGDNQDTLKEHAP